MSNSEWLVDATPDEVAAYKRGQSESTVTIRRLAKTVTALRIVLSQISRLSPDHYAQNRASTALSTTMSADTLDTYKEPES